MTSASIEKQAERFADELTATVRSVAPECDPFTALVMQRRDGTTGFTVRQRPAPGIVLRVQGEPLFRLEVAYQCVADAHGAYLAVEDSKVKVRTDGVREPLFRYEYDRDAASDMPAAHIQLHAHRDAFTHVMHRAGAGSGRGKRRAKAHDVPRIEDLHFPVGGHRFRPCLEDVLEMLVCEFGVDSTSAGIRAIHDGRERWRRMQVGAAVRDAPLEAIRVLRELGYRIEFEPGQPSPHENESRLRDF